MFINMGISEKPRVEVVVNLGGGYEHVLSSEFLAHI